MLLLIGCTSTTQDDPQGSLPDLVTETSAEIDDTTTQDEPQTPPPDLVTETQAEIDDSIAQDDPQAFPPEVIAEIQAEMDDLTVGELPPGMIMWIDAPAYQYAGASGLANLTDATPMPPEGAFRIGSITKMFTAAVII